jgi:hypothetical protein
MNHKQLRNMSAKGERIGEGVNAKFGLSPVIRDNEVVKFDSFSENSLASQARKK